MKQATTGSRLFAAGAAVSLAFGWAATASAEHINGFKTWVAKDRASVGMVHYDSQVSGRLGWTTNGTVFDCSTESLDLAAYRVVVYCPLISYRITLDRFVMSVQNASGTATYPGQWDDRRFWYYRSGDLVGRFFLKDNFLWEENQWRADALVATFQFKEYNRADDFIYVNDAGRNISVAIGKTKAFISVGGEAWREIYTGVW